VYVRFNQAGARPQATKTIARRRGSVLGLPTGLTVASIPVTKQGSGEASPASGEAPPAKPAGRRSRRRTSQPTMEKCPALLAIAPEAVLGDQARFTVANPYGKYVLGPSITFSGPNRACRRPLGDAAPSRLGTTDPGTGHTPRGAYEPALLDTGPDSDPGEPAKTDAGPDEPVQPVPVFSEPVSETLTNVRGTTTQEPGRSTHVSVPPGALVVGRSIDSKYV
jgi:hypothetical protein